MFPGKTTYFHSADSHSFQEVFGFKKSSHSINSAAFYRIFSTFTNIFPLLFLRAHSIDFSKKGVFQKIVLSEGDYKTLFLAQNILKLPAIQQAQLIK